jgi:hypothetical protein
MMNGPKHQNAARNLFEGEGLTGKWHKPVLTPEQEALKEQLHTLRSEMQQRDRLNYTARENKEYYEAKLFEIQQAHYEANQARLASLQDGAEKVRRDWEKRRATTATKDALELRRHELEYETMDKRSLQQEARRCLDEGGPDWTPERIAALGAHLKRAGVDGVQAEGESKPAPFLDQARRFHRDEPWRHDAPEVYKALDLYSAEFGQTKVLGEDGDIEPVDIAEIVRD